MKAAESVARDEGRWLLMLDTVTGSAAETFYRSPAGTPTGRAEPRPAHRGSRPRRPSSGRTSGDRSGGRLTLVFAPDSFKGSLSSVEVARALAEGWARARPGDELLLAPACRWRGRDARRDRGGRRLAASRGARPDPLGRPPGRLSRSDDGRAASSSWPRRPACHGWPRTSGTRSAPHTVGTGEVLRAALDAGVRRLVLGIGGSATTDGGAGLLRALGAVGRAADRARRPARARPAPGRHRPPDRLRRHEPAARTDGRGGDLRTAEGGGRTTWSISTRGWPLWADALEAATGRRERETPGAGAAGGIGFGLLCLADRFRPRPPSRASTWSWRRPGSTRSSPPPTS